MRKRKRLFSWFLWSLVGILLLAACTAAGGNEPTVTNEDGAVTVEEDAPAEAPAVDPTDPPPTESDTDDDETEEPEAEEPAETAVSATESEAEIIIGDDRSDRLRNLTSSWNTNWEKRTISTDEILSGGPPRDGIPSIDDPQFIPPEEAAEWLAGNEPVIALEINGDARAYPLQIMTWHEITNDEVGDVPVAVTFCPLCNSALTFDRRVNGEVLEFGTSGLLRNSDLIMYDRTTETLWQQFTGEAIVGDLAGTVLTFIPSSLVSFDDFRSAYPDGKVLSRDTGFNRRYGENPYVGYDSVDQNPFLFTGIPDERLLPMERVVTVSLDNVDVAYPLSILSEKGVIHDSPGGQELVVFHTGGTASALDTRSIAQGADVGATGVYDPNLDGRKLTFKKVDGNIVDEETGSTWNILGQAIDGPLAGEELTSIVHGDHFWFSWAAFQPDTIIYQE